MPSRRPCRYRHSSVTPPSEVGIRRTSTGRPQRLQEVPGGHPDLDGMRARWARSRVAGWAHPRARPTKITARVKRHGLATVNSARAGRVDTSHTSSGGPGSPAGKASARPGSPSVARGRRSVRGYWHARFDVSPASQRGGARRCPGWLGSLLLQPRDRLQRPPRDSPGSQLRHPQPGPSGRARGPGSAGRAPPDRFVLLRRSRRKCSRPSREPSAPSVSGRKGRSRTGLALPRERLSRGRAAEASRDRSGPRNRGGRRVQPGLYA